MKTSMLILLSALIIASGGLAQSITPQVINSTGGTARKGGYRLDWSVGELALVDEMHPENTPFFLTNGFMQAENDGVLKQKGPMVQFTPEELQILPNPTRGNLQVELLARKPGQVRIRIYDPLGLLVYTKYVAASGGLQRERIDMSGYKKGPYMLFIELYPTRGNTMRTGSYKIIKTD